VVNRKVLKWLPGRQDSGYLKMLLATATWPISFDVYLVKYPSGAYIDWHVDPVEHGEHHRLNLVLKEDRGGGVFSCSEKKQWWRFTLFRPDLHEHMVSRINKSRLILSIGWLK
jgi:hypothetical protein